MSASNLLSQRREALTTVIKTFYKMPYTCFATKATNISSKRSLFTHMSKMKDVDASMMGLIA